MVVLVIIKIINKYGIYVIAIINQFFEFQYFDENNMIFLNNMVNKGKLLGKFIYKGIDQDIIKLDLSNNNFGPLDIKYLTDFDLKNLKILNLKINPINPQGAFYLSQGNFKNLENLDLSYNGIEDAGLLYISKGFFPNLSYLYLAGNRISCVGISFLVISKFIII